MMLNAKADLDKPNGFENSHRFEDLIERWGITATVIRKLNQVLDN